MFMQSVLLRAHRVLQTVVVSLVLFSSHSTSAAVVAFQEGFELPPLASIPGNNGNWGTFGVGQSFVGDSGNIWNVTRGDIDVVVGGWNPYQGIQSIDMNGWSSGAMSTKVSLLPGAYELTFAYARSWGAPANAGLDILINGTQLSGAPIASNSTWIADDENWQYRIDWSIATLGFVVTETGNQQGSQDVDLAFLSLAQVGIDGSTAHGITIDSIEIRRHDIPTPGTFSLLLIALGGLKISTTRWPIGRAHCADDLCKLHF